MAGVSGGELAAATARGGALGSIAMPMQRQELAAEGPDPCGSLAKLREEVACFRSEAPERAPLCIGFVEDWCLQRRGDHSLITQACSEHNPEFVQVFFDCSEVAVREIRLAAPRAKIIAQVNTAKEARRVIAEAKARRIRSCPSKPQRCGPIFFFLLILLPADLCLESPF